MNRNDSNNLERNGEISLHLNKCVTLKAHYSTLDDNQHMTLLQRHGHLVAMVQLVLSGLRRYIYSIYIGLEVEKGINVVIMVFTVVEYE